MFRLQALFFTCNTRNESLSIINQNLHHQSSKCRGVSKRKPLTVVMPQGSVLRAFAEYHKHVEVKNQL